MTDSSRRLPKIVTNKSPHLGLWLDKGLDGFILNSNNNQQSQWACKNKDKAIVDLLKKAKDIKNQEYPKFFNHWQCLLNQLNVSNACSSFTVKTEDRLIVGLGTASVWENAISIHRTYGVPYIPGSALKGLASSYAHQRLAEWDKGGQAHRAMFGDVTSAGYVTFWDAMPVGSTWELHREVITTHHSGYYQGQKKKPPADWDDPIPIPFITASGTFLFAVSGPENAGKWVSTATKLLQKALADPGAGGKTSSGYGRFEVSPE